MLRIKSFIYEWIDRDAVVGQQTCRARSQTFVDSCSAFTSDADCKNYQCNGGDSACTGPTTSSACTSANSACSWNENGDKPDGVCCKDGSYRCEADADGEEYDTVGLFNQQCCDDCNVANPPWYCELSGTAYYKGQDKATYPKSDGLIYLCSSAGASCRTCTGMQNGTDTPEGEDDGKTAKQRCEEDYGKCALADGTPVILTSDHDMANNPVSWVSYVWLGVRRHLHWRHKLRPVPELLRRLSVRRLHY